MVAVHPFSAFLLPWKVGERDARMAIGLLRVDPLRRRSIPCALCYLSSGAAKVMLVGIAALLVLTFVDWLFDLRFQLGVGWFGELVQAVLVSVVIALGSVILLASVTSLMAALIGQKLWIDGRADPATALDGRWPPVSGSPENQKNAAILPALPPAMIPVCIVISNVRFPPGWLLLLSAILGGIPAILMAKRTVAETPEQCYPETVHPRSVNEVAHTTDEFE